MATRWRCETAVEVPPFHKKKKRKRPLSTFIVLHALFYSLPFPLIFPPPRLVLPSTLSSQQFSPAHYWAAVAWVSPALVTSCIRLPEAGRSTPVAQLKKVLQEKVQVQGWAWLLFVKKQQKKTKTFIPPWHESNQFHWIYFTHNKWDTEASSGISILCHQIISISGLRPSSVSEGIIKLD